MKNAFCVGAAVLAVLFCISPETVSLAAGEALSLCAQHLVPSLFPFIVCANVLLSNGFAEKAGAAFSAVTNKLFRVSGAGAAAIFLGFISGYPAGAVVCGRLYGEGRISKCEAERLVGFTNNAGPLFILGAVGLSLYQNRAAGILLYVSVLLGALFTGIIMRFYKGEAHILKKQRKESGGDPMERAIHTVLTLSGYVVFFAVIVAFLEKYGVLSSLSRLFSLLGMEEDTAQLLSVGIFEISTAAKKTGGALPCMAALLSFGGLSVFLQTAAVLKKAGLSLKPYLMGKTVSSALSCTICSLALKWYPISLESAQISKAVLYTEYLSAATLMGICVYLFYRLLHKIYS